MIGPFAPATEMIAALESREISSVELLELQIKRIERYNSQLNAIVTLDVGGAGETARDADRLRSVGEELSLCGLPVTIKDTIDVAGLPTTAGLRRREHAAATADAQLVECLRELGAVIMGKTNVSVYASDWQTDNPLFGRSNNPWDLARTPGGSTGGGAAAVAAGLSPLEFGSDIGGSIRIPASFCGIYGHRPSETAIPRSGHFPGSTSPNPAAVLNVLGPLARSAADLEMALRTCAEPEVGEEEGWVLEMSSTRHKHLRDFRVAMLPIPDWAPVSTTVHEARELVATTLREQGARVVETQPEGFGDLREHHLLYISLMATIFAFNAGTSPEQRRADADAMLAAGDDISAARARGLMASAVEFLEYHRRREAYRAAYRDFFREWDVLLSPVAPTVAFPHDDRPYMERTLDLGGESIPYSHLAIYPGVATLSGQPATAFPIGNTSAGLPIGLQAIGPYLEDRTPIRFAALLAETINGFQEPPGFDKMF